MKNIGTVPVPAVNAGMTHTPLPGSLVWLFAAASGLSVAKCLLCTASAGCTCP